jgi:hypothetical protein
MIMIEHDKEQGDNPKREQETHAKNDEEIVGTPAQKVSQVRYVCPEAREIERAQII